MADPSTGSPLAVAWSEPARLNRGALRDDRVKRAERPPGPAHKGLVPVTITGDFRTDTELLDTMSRTTDTARLVIDNALSASGTRARNLAVALENSCLMGVAIGIVIERCRLSPDDAVDLLKTIAQRDNRKLRDVASDLVSTGVIPVA